MKKDWQKTYFEKTNEPPKNIFGCYCGEDNWCSNCLPKRLNKNIHIYTGKSADGSDAVELTN